MLKIKRFTFNIFEEHTYLVYDEDSKECAVVDPGCLSIEEEEQVYNFIISQELHVIHLINTHCHIDHVVGNAYIKRTYGVKLAIHAAEMDILALALTYAPVYGISNYKPAEADLWLRPGEHIQVGKYKLQILYVPGHSPGHIALHSPESKFCISGDVLFKNCIGRTDLPGSDYETLLKSIHKELFMLEEKIIIYPGHGPSTTVGEEMKNNPFCRLKS